MSQEKEIFNCKAASKVWRDYETNTSIAYVEKILPKVDSLIVLNNEIKVEFDKDELFFWVDPLLAKFSFHVSSFLQLFLGTRVTIKGTEVKIFDEPSILALFRIILENYLTFYYIFCDSDDRDEKEFRLNVWKYCGLKQRIEFDVQQEELKRKQAKEFVELASIKEKILSSQYFTKLKKEDRNQIIKGVKPRLFSWTRILEMSGIRKKLFRNIYGYKSNYAHSEFISVLQINSATYGFNESAKEHYILLLTHSLISKLINDLCSLSKTAEKLFNKLDNDIKEEIEFFEWFLTSEELDLDKISD
jgi:hypothetical protein